MFTVPSALGSQDKVVLCVASSGIAAILLKVDRLLTHISKSQSHAMSLLFAPSSSIQSWQG